MCSSSRRTSGLAVGRQSGFTVIELLMGLVMAAVLSGAIGGVVVAQQKACAAQTDEILLSMQIGVAGARLERELRMAGAGGCPFAIDGPILEASPTQVVFLGRQTLGGPPGLVEWEAGGGSLMRRRGACPTARPWSFPHSLYVDNKTMVEGVLATSHFRYMVRGEIVEGPVPAVDLPLIEAVILHLCAVPAGGTRVVEGTVHARVSR